MVRLLAKIFIKNNKDYSDSEVRRKYGVLASFLGIFLNLLLFAGKFSAGIITNAISITADAFNNLSDAGSSLITLLGFKLSNQKPDNKHPFGHGRIEYISGLLVSIVILIMAYELIKTSIVKIFNPEEVIVNGLSIGILIASICVKAYMFLYNRSYGTKIKSNAMRATAMDSLSDSIATSVVLISAILRLAFGWNIDGFAGLLVGAFIAYAGFKSLAETMSPILGQAPEPETVKAIEEIVTSADCVTGVHDLIIHDYGPTRTFVSLHAEVPCDMDILQIHDVIDNLEVEIKTKLGFEATIHMDPVDVNDENLKAMKEFVIKIVTSIDSRLSIHDFRMVRGETHTNLIFDVLVPYDLKISNDSLVESIDYKVKDVYPNINCVIEVDSDYAGITN